MSVPTTISVNGRRTRVRVEGDPTKPPVLLLHGINRSLEDWAPQYPRLAATHRVIALDLPGSGFSHRVSGPTTLEALARSAVATLDAVGEERPVHVIGNSLGGAVAQQMLASKPDRVASLTLVGSAGFGSEVALPVRLLAVPILGRLMTLRSTRLSITLLERMSVVDPRLVTSVRIEHALAISRQPDTGPVMLETVRALASFRGVRAGWRDTLASAVSRHERPTLIVWGDRDRLLPVRHLDAARRIYPHAQTHRFLDVGHMPQVERPDDFAALVLSFLDGVEQPGKDGNSVTAANPPERRRRSVAPR